MGWPHPPVRVLRMGLDCGLRRNDEHLGAINRAPTKNLLLSACVPPAAAGGWCVSSSVGTGGGGNDGFARFSGIRRRGR